MRLPFYYALLIALGVAGPSLIAFGLFGAAYGQTMPQQQNCTTTTSGSISHTWCGPPVIVQVQAPAVTVQPAPVIVQPAPPAPKPMAAPPVEKKIKQ